MQGYKIPKKLFPETTYRVLETQNSQGNRRPDFPRSLRRCLRGKNKRKIKSSLKRAFDRGIFTKEQYDEAKRTYLDQIKREASHAS